MNTEQLLSVLSLDDLELLETLCNRIVSTNPNEDCDIVKLVADVDQSVRRHFIRELLWQDIEHRKGNGESVSEENYDFPDEQDKLIVQEVFSDLKKDNAFLSLGHPTDMQTSELPSRYESLEQIGQGGIGSVVRVFDRHSQRPLAVKKLRDKYRRDRRANLRLEREAILTGNLQHPGIPSVHDHGLLVDASVYFAMKLVDGRTFAEILESRSGNNEDLPTLIGIFEQVAQTVAYAHSEHVVHRDLKPQNIMVGKFGEVQVMDWGMGKRIRAMSEASVGASNRTGELETTKQIGPSGTDTKAKAYDSSLYDPMTSMTETGEVFGTPAYMAPEQAKGIIEAIRPSTDVFGLGAILFEILTHSRLYKPSDASEVLVMAAKGDQHDARVKLENSNADMELIELCKACLEVDQASRLQDAGQVADAITAYQDGVQSRLRKAEVDRTAAEVKAEGERKRRRMASWLSSIIALTIAVGLVGVLWQLNKATAAKEESERYAALADMRFMDAKKTVDEYLTEVSSSRDLLASTPGTEKLRRKLLEKAKSYYESFVALKPEDPVQKDELAKSYLSLGLIIQELGSESESEPYFQDCIRICEELIESGEQQPDTKKRILQCRNYATRNLITVGKIDEAIDSAKTTLELAKELAREHPDDVHSLCSVARTYYNIGAWSVAKKRPDAKGFIDEAMFQSEQLLLRFPESETVLNTRALVLMAMGSANHEEAHQLGLTAFHTGREGKKEEAKQMKIREKQLRLQSQEWLQEAFDILAFQLTLQLEESDLKAAMYNNIPTLFYACAGQLSLAFLYDRDKSDPEDYQAKQVKAAGIVRDAMKRMSEFTNRNPYLLKEKFLLIDSHRMLAIMTELDERIEILKNGMELTREEIEKHPDSVRLYRIFNDLGLELTRWLRDKSMNQAVVETRKEMLSYSQRYRRIVGDDDLEVVNIVVENQTSLADFLRRTEKPEEAVKEYESAVRLLTDLDDRGKMDQPTRLLLAKAYGSQAGILSTLGRHEKAIALKKAQFEIYREVGNNDASSVEFFESGRSLSGLVSVLLANKQWEEAIETANESEEIVEASTNKRYRGPARYVLAVLCSYRAHAFERLEKFEDARQELDNLLAMGNFGLPVGVDRGLLHTQMMICRSDILLGSVEKGITRAIEIAEDKENLNKKESAISRVILEAAGVLAMAADKAATGDLPEREVKRLVEHRCAKSVDLIRFAIKQDDFLAPFDRSAVAFVRSKIQKDSAFDAIRNRPELKDLLGNED